MRISFNVGKFCNFEIMSQRVGGGGDGTSVPAHADNSSTGPKAPEQHVCTMNSSWSYNYSCGWLIFTLPDTCSLQCYPERHHLMPGSLQKIPPWYEPAHFQHNARLLAGVIPGLILLITVTGKTYVGMLSAMLDSYSFIPPPRMVATILSGMLFTLMVRYMRSGWT